MKNQVIEPIASIWDTRTDRNTGEWVTSFSMLTVNADLHPVMNQFHKPGDEKEPQLSWLPINSMNGSVQIQLLQQR